MKKLKNKIIIIDSGQNFSIYGFSKYNYKENNTKSNLDLITFRKNFF